MPVASLRWPDKDPADVLDYSLDWSDQLALVTPADTISAVQWTLPTGLTAGAQIHANGIATTWISGGTAGTDYTVTCRMTTAGGRVLERNVGLYVRDL